LAGLKRAANEQTQETKTTNQSFQNLSSVVSPTTTKGKPSEFREIPDEIENFGMIFFNKTTLGSYI
jgi:hypothetical protein